MVSTADARNADTANYIACLSNAKEWHLNSDSQFIRHV